jgi:hypothetical protein
MAWYTWLVLGIFIGAIGMYTGIGLYLVRGMKER